MAQETVQESLEDILARATEEQNQGLRKVRAKDVSPHYIGQPIPTVPVGLPEHATRMLQTFKRQLETTAVECIRRAEECEAAAKDMRERAAVLNHQAEQIPDDFINAINSEIAARNEAIRLSLVYKLEKDDS